MTEIVERPRVVSTPTVNWGAVLPPLVAAAALASVLHAFAAAVWLAVSSTAPTRRDASIGLWFLSGVYLVLVALASYGLGGYLTGMLCERYAGPVPDESELRDNVHGLLSWAVATLITVTLALWWQPWLPASRHLRVRRWNSVASENTIAYDVDHLLRGDRRAIFLTPRAEGSKIRILQGGRDFITRWITWIFSMLVLPSFVFDHLPLVAEISYSSVRLRSGSRQTDTLTTRSSNRNMVLGEVHDLHHLHSNTFTSSSVLTTSAGASSILCPQFGHVGGSVIVEKRHRRGFVPT